MNHLDRIGIDPGICQGQPIIRGMRITVSAVLKVLAAGKAMQDVLQAYPELEEEDVRQAIEYASWVLTERQIPAKATY
jgi:uncharacterized protein (DUF433 family)